MMLKVVQIDNIEKGFEAKASFDILLFRCQVSTTTTSALALTLVVLATASTVSATVLVSVYSVVPL